MKLITHLLIVLILFPSVTSAKTFPDLNNTWFKYREAIAYLEGRGIISGYPDGKFRPEQSVNRAEFLKMVFKGRQTVKPVRRCFSDVPVDAWYAPFVCTAKRRGIIKGYRGGTYKPERTVNFAEAIKIVLRAYGREITEYSGEKWYTPYVKEMNGKGIMSDHSYLPWQEITRERAADLIARILRFDEEQIKSNLSAGCGEAKPDIVSSVSVRGETRRFLLTVPKAYRSDNPFPLIFAFHGRTNNSEQVKYYFQLDKEITDAIIVYPQAHANGNGSYAWSVANDVPFFDATAELLADRYCIDLDRLYVVGHSLGGWVANMLACVRGDTIRASATLGTSAYINECSGPVASMIIHNPNDRLAPFVASERMRSVGIEKNFCTWETVNSGPKDLNCVRHTDCYGGNDILWCPHYKDLDFKGNYYPHNWPDGTAQHIETFFDSLRLTLD